jgi:hypothetical protein
MTNRTKIALVAGTAVLALAGIGGGVAIASGTTTPAATPTTAAAHPHRAPGLLRRAEHGEVTVRTKKGDQVVNVQRGQVTAVSSTSVTVRSKDGFSAVYAVNGTSKVRSKKKQADIGAVHNGDRVLVVAGASTVRRLADAGPPK